MPFGSYSAWQYSRWTRNIARNSHITLPTDTYLSYLRLFTWAIADPNNPLATRPWLADPLYRLSIAAANGYDFDVATEPAYVLVKALDIIGRDFKKIPITDSEAFGVDILIGVSSNRRYGTAPYYGSIGGSTVAVP